MTATPVTVTVAGRELDIAPLLPFRMIHWRRLRAIGVDPVAMGQKANRGGEVSGETLQKMAYYAIQQVDPALTDDVLDQELTLPAVLKLSGAIMEQEGGKTTEGPTSTPYSSAPSDGAGGLATSTN